MQAQLSSFTSVKLTEVLTQIPIQHHQSCIKNITPMQTLRSYVEKARKRFQGEPSLSVIEYHPQDQGHSNHHLQMLHKLPRRSRRAKDHNRTMRTPILPILPPSNGPHIPRQPRAIPSQMLPRRTPPGGRGIYNGHSEQKTLYLTNRGASRSCR